MWEVLKNPVVWKTLLDFYIIFLLIIFLLKFILTNKKIFNICLGVIFLILLGVLISYLGLNISGKVQNYMTIYGPLILLILCAPELIKTMDLFWRKEKTNESFSVEKNTMEQITDACFYLSERKIGALITIECHTSLDQYAERAINMNCDVTKETLINIFIPNTPLHDGAVIIRNNKILCAAAYYVLTNKEDTEKTTGSRHRAAIGISEVSDSLTVVVSEQTGQVSVTLNGILIKIKDKEQLLGYMSYLDEQEATKSKRRGRRR